MYTYKAGLWFSSRPFVKPSATVAVRGSGINTQVPHFKLQALTTTPQLTVQLPVISKASEPLSTIQTTGLSVFVKRASHS